MDGGCLGLMGGTRIYLGLLGDLGGLLEDILGFAAIQDREHLRAITGPDHSIFILAQLAQLANFFVNY